MSSIKNPRNWLCGAAFAAAFWITLRVMAATVPAPLDAGADATAVDGRSFAGEASGPVGTEVPDPALERMIARFAGVARSGR